MHACPSCGSALDAYVAAIPREEKQLTNFLVDLNLQLHKDIRYVIRMDPGVQPIEVTCEGGRVEVADRGPGIAAADRPHVFDRFYRSTDARSRPGSGLGLSIVAEVVAGHGGRTFAAERAGGGAVVGFVLPVGPEPAGRTGATA